MVEALPLPPLRQELGLFHAPPTSDGTPTWTLHDPAANRFFLLEWPAFEILSRWSLGSLKEVLEAVNKETTLSLSEDDVLGVISFLEQNFLLDAASSQATKRLAAAKDAGRHGLGTWLLHNYLFIRLPLVRPERLLRFLTPLVSWCYSIRFLELVLLALCGALFLVSRQWDFFLRSFTAYQTVGGIAVAAFAIPIAKVIHEFGHALTAHRYGCRVPTMGIAFVVLTPMLYTDTNEAWKLTSRRRRLSIAIAGIAAEMLLAIAGLWAWLLLPDGPARGAAFILSTTTWIMTIALNASPFMRFDGYFILSDFLGIPNLHSRSFAFGRWWLREMLFGLGEPPPEPASARRRRLLTAFSFVIWVYRLVVFLGIAVLVYHYFFKALGIFLFAVEIGWFVLQPLYREMKAWYRIRERMHVNTAVVRTVCCMLLLATLFVVPWQGRLSASAVLSAAREQQIAAPIPALVTSAAGHEEGRVREGEVLVRLSSPDIEQRIRQTAGLTNVSRWQVEQQSFDERLLSQGDVPRRRLEGGSTELSGLKDEQEKLTQRAPFDGTIVSRNDELTPGLWLPRKEPLYVIADTGRNRIDAYVTEEKLERIKPGAAARFIPDAAGFGTYVCKVAEIDRINIPLMEEPMLASTYGGPIPTREDSQGAPLPEKPVFRIRIDECSPSAVPMFKLRGVVHIEAEKRSILADMFRHARAVAVREFGL